MCGYGCLASLPEGASGCTTVELKTNFLGAAREGKLTARTAAVFRCTQLVLWPRG
ncbi:phenylacetic acid degradation protein [Mycobacteroides abscessus subsp. massiliense]|uniref:phenylacetic acid degradation protein n=1 Tax=Mycobacteroides abscessus TaxID=36809 RepID=UPI0034D4A683